MFDARSARAMLIGRQEAAFNDPDYIFELKLDGDRCLAYLDPEKETLLINKRGRSLLPHLPELAEIHKQAKARCILDGELVIGAGKKSEFELIRSRLTTNNKYRLERLSRENPASFVTYDLLYLGREATVGLPLLERKDLLERNVMENGRLIKARYIDDRGLDFFNLVSAQGLEGVVAKRKGSLYQMGKRSRDWVKFKNWADDDFVICGYWPSDKANVVSLVLGQYRAHPEDPPELVYKSHVVLGRQTPDYKLVTAQPRRAAPTVRWGSSPEKHHKTIWLEPRLVCKVEYICLTPGGGLRQPIYRGLRDDKEPAECLEQDPAHSPGSCAG